MILLILTVLAIFVVLAVTELVARSLKLSGEYTRKFIHISVGSFVAFWPLFLAREQILLLSIGFLIGVVVSQYFHLFNAIHSVQRPTWGEVFFALAVGTLAYVAHSGWIYLVALLVMSIADALAAIVGIRYGRTTRYYVLGHTKSAVGTLTFLLATLAIFASYCIATGTPFNLWFVPIALAATLIENVAVHGSDNLFIPLLIALGLNLVRYF